MKKILVPMDFSDQAISALEVAVDLARKSRAEILLQHIIEIPGHFYHASGKLKGTETEKLYARELMSHFDALLREVKAGMHSQDVNIEHHVEIGSAYPGLAKAASRSRADLVVMGSRGMEESEEIFMGSTAQRMIRYANCPVLTIKNKVDIGTIQDVVYATKCDTTPFYISNQIQALTNLLEANLHVLKVNTRHEWKSHREVGAEIRTFAEGHHLATYQPEVYDDESPLEGIIHYSEDEKADLIAVMTHGKTGLSQLTSGSIAERVAGLSDLPVWTCRFNIIDRS